MEKPTHEELVAALLQTQWLDFDSCEGYQMGAPPLHYHPRCRQCKGHEPAFNAKYPRCFRTKEQSLSPPGATYRDYITVGHEPDCIFARLEEAHSV